MMNTIDTLLLFFDIFFYGIIAFIFVVFGGLGIYYMLKGE